MEDKPNYVLNGKGGELTVFADKVIIKPKGVLGLMTKGLAGSKTIPIESIQSVQLKEASIWLNGFLQFGISGGRERQGGVMSAVDDENSIVFTKDDNKLAKEIKEFIEASIVNRAKTNTVITQLSPADEILKYKELLDKGILTQEEFDKKKKELLGF